MPARCASWSASSTPTEARVAAAAGADVIDVKDPSRGALGEAAPHVVRAVREATPAHLPVSAALGDGPFTPAVAAALRRSGGRRAGRPS